MNWHLRETTAVLNELGVTPEEGLTAEEVARRQETYGPNEITEGARISPLAMLLGQFREVMVLVLIVAALVSLVLGELIDAVVILAIVVINATLGFVQEYRAEQAMAALRKMAAPNAKVRRDGKVQIIPARELVPGDIVLIEAGDAISADARLLEAANLRLMEASLTGESTPVSKHTAALEGENIPLGDRRNMLFMGTAANYGRGAAVVVNTGMRTELGNIAQLIQSVTGEETPLQRRMAQLGKTLALAALALIAIVVVLGLLRAETIDRDVLVELFLTAIAMAVAAVPEGLPAIVTIALALGAQRMLKRQALIRTLPAVETLGSVTTICSDKTGTLTQNRMTVQVVDMANAQLKLEGRKTAGDPAFHLVSGDDPSRTLEMTLVSGALCNDASIDPDPDRPGEYKTVGDPTEAALLVAAATQGLEKARLNQLFPRVGEVPFSSDRKRMTTIHRVTAEAIQAIDPSATALFSNVNFTYTAFTKGALHVILENAVYIWVNDHLEPLTEEWRNRIEAAHNTMAEQGLRVLGMAAHALGERLPDPEQLESVEERLTFLGLVGMMDPARPEVKEAVALCRTAGIRPVMITGDHPITAKEIAKQLDIAQPGDRVIIGRELEQMSIAELEQVVEHVPIFARVSPEHKLNIVQALQNRGHVVAMTGDGVNDAPALRRSDIGVAMGITGTDVSKEASNMVILDDNFATIVAAVKEGRTIYENVRKFLQYTLMSNAGEIYVMLFAPFFGMPLPLSPLQILWINLVTDGLPGLALAVEPAEKDAMRRPPYALNESIFSRGIGQRVIWGGFLFAFLSLGIGYLGFSGRLGYSGTDHEGWWRTLLFNTLTLSQMANALAIRSNRESLFSLGLRSNMLLVYAVLLTLALQIAVIYVPFMQNIFGTVALSARDFGLTLALSAVMFVAIELEKWIQRRRARDT